MTPELIIAAILALFPHMSGNNRACMERHQDRLVAQLHELERPVYPGAPVIPLDLMAVVGFVETHLGCDAGEGGNWGAPIDAAHRGVAGTHFHAARSLAWSYQVCGTWEGAVFRFRTGLCRPEQFRSLTWRFRGRHYTAQVFALRARVQQYVQAHTPSP